MQSGQLEVTMVKLKTRGGLNFFLGSFKPMFLNEFVIYAIKSDLFCFIHFNPNKTVTNMQGFTE